jgi:hypothetical protein
MDSPDISVYGEAKGEYTRQLCVFITPSLESYFLKLLEEAKAQSPNQPQKYLWNFQNLLQAIPDWNQDKVLRETEEIQKDSRCDYLEELLTAVFIAHTKVLSAIRLTTKQKKLQITIPKIDHFLHRVMSECARSLWANAFLFAETNSIEKQKNLRQVSGLVHESILQAIRGLLPVKAILREYLHEDEDGEDEDVGATGPVAPAAAAEEIKVEEKVSEEAKVEETHAEVKVEETHTEAKVEEAHSEAKVEEAHSDVKMVGFLNLDSDVKMVGFTKVEEPVVAPEQSAAAPEQSADAPLLTSSQSANAPLLTSSQSANAQPTIYIDTKPSVTFSNDHVMFDSNNLEENEIQELPFAEAELREDEDDDEDDYNQGTLQMTDEVLQMNADEILG